MVATWPLTGRAEELSVLSRLAHRGDGPVGVVLAGAAGVGKTRLAREALAVAAQRGALTRWAVATVSDRPGSRPSDAPGCQRAAVRWR